MICAAVGVAPRAPNDLGRRAAPPHRKCVSQCFSETMERQTLTVGAFEARDTALTSEGLQVEVISPKGSKEFSKPDITTGKFAFTTTEEGAYRFCFTNPSERRACLWARALPARLAALVLQAAVPLRRCLCGCAPSGAVLVPCCPPPSRRHCSAACGVRLPQRAARQRRVARRQDGAAAAARGRAAQARGPGRGRAQDFRVLAGARGGAP